MQGEMRKNIGWALLHFCGGLGMAIFGLTKAEQVTSTYALVMVLLFVSVFITWVLTSLYHLAKFGFFSFLKLKKVQFFLYFLAFLVFTLLAIINFSTSLGIFSLYLFLAIVSFAFFCKTTWKVLKVLKEIEDSIPDPY